MRVYTQYPAPTFTKTTDVLRTVLFQIMKIHAYITCTFVGVFVEANNECTTLPIERGDVFTDVLVSSERRIATSRCALETCSGEGTRGEGLGGF